MSEKIREEIWEVIVEGSTDILNLSVDLITAPFLAICRVASDFIYGKGKYKHSHPDSRGED